VFWLLGRVVNTVRRLQILAGVLSLLSVPLALTAIWNYASGAFVYGRVVGYESMLAGNPNDLALTLDILIPLSVALALTSASAWRRAGAAGAAVLSVAAVVVTFSRGGFLGL